MNHKHFRYSFLSLCIALTTAGLTAACSHIGKHSSPHGDHASHSIPVTSTTDGASETDGQSHDHHNHSKPATDEASKADGQSPGHNNHSAPTPQANKTKAKLITSGPVAPNQLASLTIEIQDQQGQAIPKFDVFQEKLMHLIVVSDNLQSFQHIHPEYKENGRFDVAAAFPESGTYTLFSDYKPAGQAEEVSALKLQVSGVAPSPPAAEFSRSKTIGDIQANLDISQPQVKVGEEVTLTFTLQSAESLEPLTDLEPYLGELGHLVIVKQSADLSRADYIHAHALPGAKDGTVQFHTVFPLAGKYKLWGQFQRNGEIVTSDFWLEVS
ncbi:hypothetical protein [Leptothoe sp. PORK10 BA2]|uniref:hypothetical protein n=1 Tax=Leptothoe sp. PORK10 BA2 TaxID=3110254 RepID=UPI002B20D035|nr:hypothetical protein [Leptothoe sp. PORK10 BA2]MEA5463604.1 hypothetical protein [Leptothoe sp. PORK10 BA2]